MRITQNRQMAACKLVCWKMKTTHANKSHRGVFKVHFVDVLPDGLQRCDHQGACIVKQKQSCQ